LEGRSQEASERSGKVQGIGDEMQIEVIGYKGIVGGATYELFTRLGYGPHGTDKGDPHSMANVYFICVPEGAVEDVVRDLRKHLHIGSHALIVVRSSVAPGTCRGLQSSLAFHICHNPEFLREVSAVQDEFNPDRVVIGECCKHHGDMLESLYRPLRVPIVRTDPTTSELVKFASNNYLSTVISYWNTVEEVAKRVGVSGHQVGMIASMDPRISSYGARFHGKYGGRCLPKDAQQLIKFSESIGYDPILIKAVEEVNNLL